MNAEWSVDLANWHGQPDPEVAGSTVWVHTDYDGQPDIALASDGAVGWPSVSVIKGPVITPTEIDGENLGSFTSWNAALDFALSELELS